MKLRRWVSLLILLGLVDFAGCAAPKPRGETAGPKKTAELPPTEINVRGGQIYLTDPKTGRLWTATADSIVGDFPSGRGKLRNVKCSISENKKTVLNGRAAGATYLPEKKEVILRGKVIADWAAKGLQVTADQMTWALETGKIDARGHVKLTRPGEVLTGERLLADIKMKSFEMRNGEEKR
jgi:LPS export ABC transporter protein LptC